VSAAAAPPTALLEQALTTDGLPAINFFNGRLLTGEDLSREQASTRAARQRLGRAIGPGVAHGLVVTEATGRSTPRVPVVSVTRGLAVNALGDTLELTGDTDLSLIDAPPAPGDPAGPDFVDCAPGATVTVPAGTGTFVLSIGPSRTPAGRAPVSGLGNDGDGACNVDASIDGVRFRLVRLALPDDVVGDADRLRSRVAALMLGVAEPQRRLASDPFATAAPPETLLETVRRTCLDPYDVPLGVVHWTAADGIRFVDRWAVRRRLVAPAAGERWVPAPTGRSRAEAEALVLQFQDQLDDLRRTEPATLLAAHERFVALPPIALVPLAGGAHRGFDATRFCEGMTLSREAHIEGGALAGLVQEALAHAPTPLPSPRAVRRYVVRDNQQAPGAQRVLVLVNGLVRHRADAQFDLFHFDLANYAQRYC
jgi:hypothetical protein